MPYKVFLSVINVVSCYYSLVKYARYFAKTRPKLTEDHKAVGIVLRLEEEMTDKRREIGRRRTSRARTVGVRIVDNGTAELPAS